MGSAVIYLFRLLSRFLKGFVARKEIGRDFIDQRIIRDVLTVDGLIDRPVCVNAIGVALFLFEAAFDFRRGRCKRLQFQCHCVHDLSLLL